MESQSIKITPRMLLDVHTITFVRANVNGFRSGLDKYPDQRNEIYLVDRSFRYGTSKKGDRREFYRYNYRTDLIGDISYSTGEMANKLNRAMDNLDKKGMGYEIHLERHGANETVFTNIQIVNRTCKIGERFKRKNDWYLSTPTY